MLGHWLRRLLGRPATINSNTLASDFLRAAAARGLPRGLIWKQVEPMGDPKLVGELLLVPLLARFEPMPGSEMEAIPAAWEPRPIVGIFEQRRGLWQPRMPPVFNHSLEQVAANLQGR